MSTGEDWLTSLESVLWFRRKGKMNWNTGGVMYIKGSKRNNSGSWRWTVRFNRAIQAAIAFPRRGLL